MSDIGKPHKVMTKEEYEMANYERPHIVARNCDGAGNVAYWPLDPVLAVEFDRGLTTADFCARFTAHMIKMVGSDKFQDGESISNYAEQTAPTYYDDAQQRAEGPEACAEADMSYWGD